MIEQTRYVFAALAIAAAPLGCSTEPHAADASQQAHGGWISIDDAVQKLAAERCNRDVSCTNVDKSHRFADGDACMREIHRNTKAEIAATPCSLAVDAERLDACIEAVHNKGCENTLDRVTRIPACRAESLCVQLSRGSMGG